MTMLLILFLLSLTLVIISFLLTVYFAYKDYDGLSAVSAFFFAVFFFAMLICFIGWIIVLVAEEIG